MYTKKDIIEQLEKMNAPRNSIVTVHTSLRSVGEVDGGGEALLDVLIEYFTSEGGLLGIPTHTWGNIKKQDVITLDMVEPYTNLGALPSMAAADKRGVRSEHPTHSMTVYGDRKRAQAFVADDANATTPAPREGCYGKIYDNKGYILLIGVAQSRNTYLHCVEEMLDVPDRLTEEFRRLTVRKESSEIVERYMKTHKTSFTKDLSARFIQYDTAFRYHGCITDGFIGNAPAQLCDAVKLKETVELIFKNSGGEDPLSTELPIPPKWYC